MTDTQLRDAFEEQGYKVVKVKRWRDGDVYVEIRDRSKLVEASEYGRTLGVIVSVKA